MVCVGEGENALIDLCNKIGDRADYTDVTNLWIKKNGCCLKIFAGAIYIFFIYSDHSDLTRTSFFDVLPFCALLKKNH